METRTTPNDDDANRMKTTPLKRKLTYEGKTDCVKKQKRDSSEKATDCRVKKSASEATNVSPKRKSRKETRASPTNTSDSSGLDRNSGPVPGEIENLVFMADISLFQQAQAAVKNESVSFKINTIIRY